MINQDLKEFIKDNELIKRCRKKRNIYLRAYLYAYMRQELKMTYEDIGAIFKRDRNTVSHAVSNVHKVMKHDPDYNDMVIILKDKYPISHCNEDIERVIPVGLGGDLLRFVNLHCRSNKIDTYEEAIVDMITKLYNNTI